VWLYIPSPSVPASGCSTSEPKPGPTSSDLDLCTRSVTSSGKLAPLRSWQRAWKMGRFHRLQFGRISQHSMRADFDAWIFSQRGSLASRTPWPERSAATMTSEPAGPTSSESWTTAIRRWFSSKTYLTSSTSGSPSKNSSLSAATESWVRCSSELQTLAQGISGSGFSCWPTATANDDNKTPEAHLRMKQRMGERDGTFANRTAVTSLQVYSQMWPTARREDGESCGNHPNATDSLTGATGNWMTPHGMSGMDHKGNVGGGGEFAKQVQNWSTPRTITGGGESGDRKKELGRDESGGGDLQAQAAIWQTPATDSFRSRGGDRKHEMGLDQQVRSFFPSPAARDWKGANAPEGMTRQDGKSRADQLANFVEYSIPAWRTPCERDHHPHGLENRTRNVAQILLAHQAEAYSPSSPQGPAPPSGRICWCNSPNCDQPSHRRRLNPVFAEWLMGWPLHWTNEQRGFDAQGMESYRLRLRQHLCYWFSRLGVAIEEGEGGQMRMFG
jgi:hypothetical protein